VSLKLKAVAWSSVELVGTFKHLNEMVEGSGTALGFESFEGLWKEDGKIFSFGGFIS
jgi:hypothetical protein